MSKMEKRVKVIVAIMVIVALLFIPRGDYNSNWMLASAASPEVSGLMYTPSNPYYDQSVKVTVLIYDQDGDLWYCYLKYTINGGDVHSSLLYKGAGVTSYYGVIFSYSYDAGDFVSFWILATDLQRHEVESSVYSFNVLDDEYYETDPDPDPDPDPEPVYTDDPVWDGDYDNSPPGGVGGTTGIPINSMILILFAGASLLAVIIMIRRNKK